MSGHNNQRKKTMKKSLRKHIVSNVNGKTMSKNNSKLKRNATDGGIAVVGLDESTVNGFPNNVNSNKNNSNNSSLPVADLQKIEAVKNEMADELQNDIVIQDSFTQYDDMNTIFRGKRGLIPEDFHIIDEAIAYYIENEQPGSLHNAPAAVKLLKKLYEKGVKSFKEYQALFGNVSNECTMSYFLTGYYKDKGFNLITRLSYTFNKVLPLKSFDEWYDNYRLTAYLDAFNQIMYQNYDNDKVFTIPLSAPKINTNQKLSNPVRVLCFAVGALRAFMLVNRLLECDLTPELKAIYESLSDINTSRVEYLFEHMNSTNKEDQNDALRICDACAKVFPFFSGGAHGCDIFDIPKRSLNVSEIKECMKRYPDHYYGYILNTMTYASGRGQHWVAVMFLNSDVKLICSQGSDFSCFHDGGKFVSSINDLRKEYNTTTIQTDNCNCGLFSTLDILFMLMYHGDIQRTVQHIGVEAKNIVSGASINNFREKLGGVKNIGFTQ